MVLLLFTDIIFVGNNASCPRAETNDTIKVTKSTTEMGTMHRAPTIM
ncbi:hypothetical protein SBF1_880032 [Candidatus Desulfosporosinus infrequens]|uniref:Uncharacterized protein n=1 Tax=Candidatus Desulfosporosinus infrequens TaxID=2043169 RepID=A0A2U3LVM6_9FIRM|nr:hypothetical protein SBF1_880032 [Candidatus Desulfosporosinus infrequens]